MKEKIIYRRSAESIWKGGGVVEFLRLKNCLSRFPEKRQALLRPNKKLSVIKQYDIHTSFLKSHAKN